MPVTGWATQRLAGYVCYSLTMRWIPLLTIVGLTFASAGCAQAQNPAVSTPPGPVQTASAQSQPKAPHSQPSQPAATAASARLTISRQGQPIAFSPTGVYCNGQPGSLRHLIAKTNNQLPLVEVTPGQFAMVKLEQRGAPEKTTNLAGITVGHDSITFSGTTIGQITLDGTLTCTKFEG